MLNATSHGLGLSICHQIAKGLGGSLTFESEVGKGSTFTLEFEAKMIKKEPKKSKITPVSILIIQLF